MSALRDHYTQIYEKERADLHERFHAGLITQDQFFTAVEDALHRCNQDINDHFRDSQ